MAKKKAKKTCADCIHEWACQAWMLGTNHNTDAQGCAMHETVRESAAYFIGLQEGKNAGWISAKDRLPEDGQVVLFHERDGFIYCAEYMAASMLHGPLWFIDNDSWEAHDVTHWMPLPEPPKEGADHV